MLYDAKKDLLIDRQFLNSLYRDYESTDDSITHEINQKNYFLECKDLIVDVLKDNFISEDNLSIIKDRIKKDTDRLNWKIKKTVEKLKGAILAERNMTNIVYSTILHIDKEHSKQDTTTTSIIDNIIFGVPVENTKISRYSPISVQHLHIKDAVNNSIKNNLIADGTAGNVVALNDFSITPRNMSQEVLELSINLPGVVSTNSLLIVDIQSYQLLEVLIDDTLFATKKLCNKFTIPVNSKNVKVTLRFYNLYHKPSVISFNHISISNYIYSQQTVYESLPIAINQALDYFCIDTCDNSEDNRVSIDYAVSINGAAYESVLPVNKSKNKSIQTIIAVDKNPSLQLSKITGTKINQSDIRFYITEGISVENVYVTDTYQPNTDGIINTNYSITVPNDTSINFYALVNSYPNAGLVIDNQLVLTSATATVANSNIILNKGIRSLFIIDTDTNVIQAINYTYMKDILGASNIFINYMEKSIKKDSGGNKYVTFTELELQGSADFANDLYYIYVPGLLTSNNVSTLQIKVIMNSIDNMTCPYISRMIIRGS